MTLQSELIWIPNQSILSRGFLMLSGMCLPIPSLSNRHIPPFLGVIKSKFLEFHSFPYSKCLLSMKPNYQCFTAVALGHYSCEYVLFLLENTNIKDQRLREFRDKTNLYLSICCIYPTLTTYFPPTKSNSLIPIILP